MSLNLKGKVITVRPEETITTKQNLPYYIGISQAVSYTHLTLPTKA